MFSLGNKEAIVNSTAKYKAAVSGTTLSIEGYGKFDTTQILSVTGQRFIAGRNAALEITAPSIADLGIVAGDVNIPVVAHIRVNTVRHSSEWAIDFIKRGRPFIFELLISGTDTSATIAAKLVSAFAEYEAKFNYSDRGLPYTWAIASDVVTLTLKDPYLSFQEYVDFLPKGQTYGVKADSTKTVDTGITLTAAASGITTGVAVSDVTGLLVGDEITINAVTTSIVDIDAAGLTIDVADAVTGVIGDSVLVKMVAQEPTFDGKYLEENVRMSLPSTSDSYGISPDEKPMISGAYTAVTFIAKESATAGIGGSSLRHKFLGGTRGEVGGQREFTFTLYFLEGTDMFNTGGKVDTIVNFLYNTAVPTTKALYIADGSEVTVIADFIA